MIQEGSSVSAPSCSAAVDCLSNIGAVIFNELPVSTNLYFLIVLSSSLLLFVVVHLCLSSLVTQAYSLHQSSPWFVKWWRQECQGKFTTSSSFVCQTSLQWGCSGKPWTLEFFLVHFLDDYSLKTLHKSQRISCFIARETLVLWLTRRSPMALGNHKKYSVGGLSVLTALRIPKQRKVVSVL